MPRTRVILLASTAVLLGAVALWRGLPRDAKAPPDRPAADGTSRDPGKPAGAGATDAAESEGAGTGPGSADRVLRGRVVTGEEGETPVPGARVLAFDDPDFGGGTLWIPSRDSPGPVRPVAEATSWEDGGFDLSLPADCSRDTLFLIARADGFADGDSRAGVEEETEIALELLPESADWRVMDLAERPVAGAEVCVYGVSADGLPRRRTVTDDRGGFTATFSERDLVLVRAEGYATAALDELEKIQPRIVFLHPGFPLAGHLRSSSGAAVEGAVVVLNAGNWNERLVTAADGGFRFSGLSGSGSACIEVDAPGFLPARYWPDTGREDLVFVLRSKGEATPTGRAPVKEVLPVGVRAKRTRFDVLRLPERRSVNFDLDESRFETDGSFVLTDLPSGEYEIQSEYGVSQKIPYQAIEKTIPRYRGSIRVRVEAGREAPPAILKLKDIGASYACIRVLDAAGRPVEGVRLHCETPGLGRFTEDHHWYTSPSGRIVTAVEGPPGATVTYGAFPDPHHEGIPTTMDVVTVAGTTGPFTDLVLRPGARISIRVLDPDGRPLPEEARLMVEVKQEGSHEWMSGGPWPVNAAPGHPGVFRTNLLPDRPFTVRVHTFRHTASPAAFPAPGEGEHEVEVRLAFSARLSGRLLSPGGNPPRDVSMKVLDEKGRDVAVAAISFVGGYFNAGSLPPGRLTFIGEAVDRQLIAVRELELSAGEELDLGDVTMRPMDLLRGAVLGTDGRPVGGAEVTLRRADRFGDRMRTVTRMDGTFELARRFCARPLLVARSPDGFAKALVPISEKTELLVRLQTTGEVFARFEPPVAIRLSGPTLTVETADGILCFPHSPKVWTSAQRLEGYRLSRVPPGDLVIRFEGRRVDGRPLIATARVTVKPGESIETLLR